MKRFLWAVLLYVSALYAALLIRYADTPDPDAAPAPMPTPAPRTLLLLPDARPSAFEKGLRAAGSESFPVENAHWQELGDKMPEDVAAVIVCAPGADAEEKLELIEKSGLPALCCVQAGTVVPENAYALTYDPSGAAETALYKALSFPPHDTPVRLIGLFESDNSEACRAFLDAVDCGKILSKGIFIREKSDDGADAFLARTVSCALPGTLDGVYAESAALACAAAEAVLSANLLGLEVFSAEVSDELLSVMDAHPDVLPAAVGRDDAFAGAYLRASAERLLLGFDVPKNAALLPRLFESTPAFLFTGKEK